MAVIRYLGDLDRAFAFYTGSLGRTGNSTRKRGRYGEFKVLVDGGVVIDGGALACRGVLPTVGKVVSAVKGRLAS